MNFIIAATTDIGIKKKTNQDSLTVKTISTNQGKMSLAVLCDGMGGLEKGEVASATLIQAFNKWCMEELPSLCNRPIEEHILRAQWENIVRSTNEKLKQYGRTVGVQLGTTVVAMLLTETNYYIMNVGDSRAYEISDYIYQLTKDQTFVEKEIELGRMTREQAETDSRRSVLLQCVGASEQVYPDMFVGNTRKDAVYMLCSDGFRHVISSQEIYNGLNPNMVYSQADMENNARMLIETVKQRQENDNISVAMVRTF